MARGKWFPEYGKTGGLAGWGGGGREKVRDREERNANKCSMHYELVTVGNLVQSPRAPLRDCVEDTLELII